MFTLLGKATSTAGGSRVGGISTPGKRERNGNCTDQTGTVTEVGSTGVSNVFLEIILAAFLDFTNAVMGHVLQPVGCFIASFLERM